MVLGKRKTNGYIAQWLEQLTADQQVPGSIRVCPLEPVVYRIDIKGPERPAGQPAEGGDRGRATEKRGRERESER